jgi:hypothetical protein
VQDGRNSVTPIAAHNERSARLAAIDALPDKLRIVTVLAGIEEHDLRGGTGSSRRTKCAFSVRQRLKGFCDEDEDLAKH